MEKDIKKSFYMKYLYLYVEFKQFKMKKHTTLFALLLFAVMQGAFAQIIFTGTVYDKDTNQPIPDVYVSFNGTMAYAITDDSGKFELTVTQRLITQLVFSHIAYHTVIIENPFDEFPEKIYMEQRSNILNNVVVSVKGLPEYADPFSRAQKLRAFREQFLGTTRAGRACIIMNENDIELRYDVRTNTLYAFSDNPVVVLNEYLGYMVSFTLLDFKVEYAIQKRSFNIGPVSYFNEYVALGRNNVQQSYYAVMSSFTDLNPDDERIKSRRDDVYEQSSTSFFKNIANNTLDESGFRFYEIGRRYHIDQSKYFTIEEDDTPWLKKIRVISSSDSMINVRYRSNRLSILNFRTDTLLVDSYGNIDHPNKVIFRGVMGDARVGEMLPLDYEPN